jgi:hypothetical protein
MAGDAPAVPTGWLGAAVSIRPPVAVEFHRAAGANLLMVGAGERLALGMLATVALGLASSGDTSVDIVDGSRPGEPGVDTWPAVVAAGGDRVRWHEPRSATGVIAELHDELARRQSAADESAPSRFLLVYNAARIRELRKSDDDFGFSFTKSEAPASAAQQFIDLLKNGPAWGVHVLVWCDNYNSLMRIVERTTLREFVHRVVLQMAAGDSSNLVDTPAAARLSEFRALLYSDETGDCEKFRPYEVPSESWLAALAGSQQVSQ